MTAEEKKNCVDLAQQFYDNQHLIDVALGGGWRHFCHEDNEVSSRKCYRTDVDLTEKFKADERLVYMETRDELLRLTADGTTSKWKKIPVKSDDRTKV